MKLIIQIPCYNEAESLPETILALPRRISGIERIEYLVIDDGSNDNTSDVARACGAHHIIRHRANRGLAAAFQTGIDAALAAGADIIVNTDADNQYDGNDIEALVQPILQGQADIVIGDRGVHDNPHFKPFKRRLQRIGSNVVRFLSGTQITDAVSGFRAISRSAAEKIFIVSSFSYTTEMLIQAGRKRMSVVSVPIRTNAPIRPSRLFSSIQGFVMNTCVTMARAYAMFNPLRVFVLAGLAITITGLLPIIRFLVYFAMGEGEGRIQSLVLGGAMLVLGIVAMMFGIVADLIGRNRQLLETTLERVRRIESRINEQNVELKTDEVVTDTVPATLTDRTVI